MKKFLALSVFIFLSLISIIYPLNPVDWKRGVIEANGYGVPPTNAVSAAQSNILARNAAIADGIKNLLEQIKVVNIDATTTVQNAMASDETYNSKITKLIKGARVIKEEWTPEGLYHVVTHVNLFGTNSLAFATLSAIRAIENISPASYASEDPGVSQELRYTGLVIDSRSKPVDKAIVLIIYDEDGRIIYNTRNLSDAVLIARGTCKYDKTENRGKPDFSAGSSPLTVKSLSLRDSNHNIIVSRDDGLKILSAAKQNNFLSQSAVTILVDFQ